MGSDLVLEAVWEVAHEEVGLVALRLSVLHGPLPKQGVEMHGQHSAGPLLIPGGLLACGGGEGQGKARETPASPRCRGPLPQLVPAPLPIHRCRWESSSGPLCSTRYESPEKKMPWFSRATGTGFSFSTRQTCRPGSCTEAGNGESLREGRGVAVVARAREERTQADTWEDRGGRGLWCGDEGSCEEGSPWG